MKSENQWTLHFIHSKTRNQDEWSVYKHRVSLHNETSHIIGSLELS